MKKTILLFALLYISSFCISQPSKPTPSGLEVSNPKIIPIRVLPIQGDTNNAAITTEQIKTKCEFKIRQMNLQPSDFYNSENPYMLEVSVMTCRRGFFIGLYFIRPVSYMVHNKNYDKNATTWSTAFLGDYVYNPDYILSSLDELLEEFINAYVKANSR